MGHKQGKWDASLTYAQAPKYPCLKIPNDVYWTLFVNFVVPVVLEEPQETRGLPPSGRFQLHQVKPLGFGLISGAPV